MVKLQSGKNKRRPARLTPAAGRPVQRGVTRGVAKKSMEGPVLARPANLPMYCQCLADPSGSPPCRVPDEYVSPTNALKVTDEYTITTDANGYAAFGVAPSLARANYTHVITTTTGVQSVTTSTYTAHPDYTSLTASFANGRQVTAQIIISYIGPVQTSCGRLIAIESDTVAAIDNNNPLSAVYDDGESSPAVDGKVIILRPTQSPRFESLGATGFMSQTFPYWQFIVAGGDPGKVVFSVRVVRHLELIPLKASIMRGSAAPEPFNPDALAIGANMSQVAKTGSLEQASSMKSMAIKAANTAWAALGPQVASSIATYGPKAATWASEALLALM